jgi:hypothetical protein
VPVFLGLLLAGGFIRQVCADNRQNCGRFIV